ncbi:MAG: hypothetical protein L6N96_02820, partial [Candidatus Methylarchaceae archaeon HK02M2]|nr:hypothetical protein [Candidatus Methylarchaceae archaeon HK02M2]
WVTGKTIRVTSEETGIPEGTVAYYYKKFNKNPNKNVIDYKTLSEDSEKSPSFRSQVLSAFQMKNVKDTYFDLIKEKKYHQAKAYLESVVLFHKIMSQLGADLRDPKIFGPILLAPEPIPGEDPLTYMQRALKQFQILGIWP